MVKIEAMWSRADNLEHAIELATNFLQSGVVADAMVQATEQLASHNDPATGGGVFGFDLGRDQYHKCSISLGG
jgi:hypothetical protein